MLPCWQRGPSHPSRPLPTSPSEGIVVQVYRVLCNSVEVKRSGLLHGLSRRRSRPGCPRVSGSSPRPGIMINQVTQQDDIQAVTVTAWQSPAGFGRGPGSVGPIIFKFTVPSFGYGNQDDIWPAPQKLLMGCSARSRDRHFGLVGAI